MAALAVLSLLIVETPLMLLERGQYGRIMAALEALYGKQVDYKNMFYDYVVENIIRFPSNQKL